MKGLKFRKLASSAVAMGLTVGLSLGAASMTNARPAGAAADSAAGSTELSPGLEQVDSIPMLVRPWSWQPVDNRTVILWATPFRPYLVELAFPSHDLRFAQGIGVTSFGDRVYAKFDSVRVRGFQYPIHAIYKMTREEAKTWGKTS